MIDLEECFADFLLFKLVSDADKKSASETATNAAIDLLEKQGYRVQFGHEATRVDAQIAMRKFGKIIEASLKTDDHIEASLKTDDHLESLSVSETLNVEHTIKKMLSTLLADQVIDLIDFKSLKSVHDMTTTHSARLGVFDAKQLDPKTKHSMLQYMQTLPPIQTQHSSVYGNIAA